MATYSSIGSVSSLVREPLFPNQEQIPDYGPLERIMRLNIFGFAVIKRSPFESFFLNRFENCLLERGRCSCEENYNPERLGNSKNLLKRLGGEVKFLETLDDRAEIETIYISASKLEEEISELGGRWKRVTLEKGEEEVLAIVPPDDPSDDWKRFYSDTLMRMRWEEVVDRDKTILVTARNAHLIPQDTSGVRCIQLVQMNRSYAFSRSITSFFLGMKLDVAAYDGRGIGQSRGTPCESGAYADADTLFQDLIKKKKLSADEICLWGSCINTFVATFLLEKYSADGVNAYFETPPPSLNEIIDQKNCFQRLVARRNLERAIHFPSKKPHSYKTDMFDTAMKLGSLSSDVGFVVCSTIAQDEALAPDRVEHLKSIISSRAHRSDRIHLLRLDTGKDEMKAETRVFQNPHMQRAHLSKRLSKRLTQVLFE